MCSQQLYYHVILSSCHKVFCTCWQVANTLSSCGNICRTNIASVGSAVKSTRKIIGSFTTWHDKTEFDVSSEITRNFIHSKLYSLETSSFVLSLQVIKVARELLNICGAHPPHTKLQTNSVCVYFTKRLPVSKRATKGKRENATCASHSSVQVDWKYSMGFPTCGRNDSCWTCTIWT